MDYIFISETSISSNTEPHEHEIKFYKDYSSPVELNDRFIKDGKNYYVVYAGTPIITYYSSGTAEHDAEITRIKNYIDSLETTHIDYDELTNELRVYVYADELADNVWLDYDNSWQSDVLPCKIMSGQRNVAMSRYGTPDTGSYAFRYSRLHNNVIEYNSESTKLVFAEGNEFAINGTSYDRDVCILITGNVSVSTTSTTYVAIIEDAV